MADSEKLTALKKAYADIILNTAKEAAARIMASERKAQRYQRELFAAKDEALRMLLRLKQMLDAKVSEAEMTSKNHQRRIEELEAQLGEAEDIVKDLRAELRELQDELDGVTNSQMQPLMEQNSDDIATHVITLDENRLSTSGSIISSLPTAECVPTITPEMRSPLNGTCNGSKCCNGNVSHKENCFIYKPDFASIMIRSKEPELYRNGCTQRIRAFEAKLLGGNLPPSGEAEANGAKSRIFIGCDTEDGQECRNLTTMAENMPGVQKWPDEFQVTDGNCPQDPVVKSFLRKKKRKRATRYRKNKAPSFKSLPDPAVNDNFQSGEDATENTLEEKHLATPKTPAHPKEIRVQSNSVEVMESHVELKNVKHSTDDMEMPEREAASAGNLEFQDGKMELETGNMLLVNSEHSMSDATEMLPTQPINNKFLKYTFQRKRKKDPLSSPDGDSFTGNITPKRNMGEELDGPLGSENSSLITEASRDGHRLAQVARQLVSLSEMNWRS